MTFIFKSLGVVLAIVLFGVGLLAPLTPSEGMPANNELLTYWIFPLALLAFGWIKTPDRVLKYISLCLFFLVGGFYSYMLYLMSTGGPAL